MSDKISMEVLARFAILPGAAELMEAFSAIPPGPMRDAVIHLAMTTAATYTGHGAPPVHHPISRINEPPKQLQPPGPPPTRTGREPPTESLEMQIVKLRIEGMESRDIATHLRVDIRQVYQAIYLARKAGAPIPRREAPKGKQNPGMWAATLDELSPTGLRMTESAANARGISVQAYLDRRNLAMRLAIEGESWEAILKATGETNRKVVSAWMSAARGAGHVIPFITAEDSPHRHPEAAAPRLEAVG